MKKWILIICLGLLVLRCGPRLVYPNLEWLIPWYVDDYISLNREQSSMLEKRLLQQLGWHCRTQLPVYARSLRQLAKDLDDQDHSISFERIQYYQGLIVGYWGDLTRQIGPDMADILKTASDEQIDELFQNLEIQNQKYRSKYVDLPPNESAQKRQQRMAKDLKHWIGRLTTEQKEAIADWSEQLKPLADDRLQYRQTIVVEFRNLLEQRNHNSDFQTMFAKRLVHLDQLKSPEYRKKIEYNTEATLTFLMSTDRSLTPTQRAHLLKRIESLAADFDKLSCDPAEVKRRELQKLLPNERR